MNIAHELNCSKCVVCNEMEVIGWRKRHFYRFPREIEKCRAWIRAIGMESLVYMPLVELYEQVVCDAHFPQQCFSERGSRLHKITLPTISQYPSLPDNIMALWPKSAMRVNPPQTCGLPVSDQSKEAVMNLLTDDEHIIDYNQPLMTCLETIKHNERYHVKKPAGNSNTISVPLMTYSSSLERGTIFSAPEAKKIDFIKLPKLHFQDDVNGDPVIQEKNENPRDDTNKKVFYGLQTKICANKSVKRATKLNRNIIKHHNKESEMNGDINSIHSLLNNSQIDKSRIKRQYKPIKKCINLKLSNSELLNVPNSSVPKEPNQIKDLPLEARLSNGITGTYNQLIIEQSTQTKDSTLESPYTQDNNIKDILPLTQCIDTVLKEGDLRKRTPMTLIDVTLPLLRCMDIVDYTDLT